MKPILTWDAASFSASEPPSFEASRADGASALKAPELAYDAARSGDLWEGVGPAGHLK